MRMPLILTRLLVFLASWSVSSRHPRTWEEWVRRRPVSLRMPLLPSSNSEPQPSLEVSPSQAELLRSLVVTEGFRLLRRLQDRLSQEASDYLHDAETPEDFRYRKGFWDGHLKTMNYTDVLISMAESSDTDYLEQEVGKLMEPFRQMGLPEGKEEEEQEQNARLSRVMRRLKQNSID